MASSVVAFNSYEMGCILKFSVLCWDLVISVMKDVVGLVLHHGYWVWL